MNFLIRISTYIFTLLFFNYQRTEKNTVLEGQTEQSFSTCLDTNKMVVFDFTPTFKWIFPDKSVRAEITCEDIKLGEQLLNAKINTYNEKGQLRKDSLKKYYPDYQFFDNQFIITLDEYRRQYIAVTTPSGDKLLHINFFCGNEGLQYWKVDYVRVNDGGNCFFQILISINQNKILEFEVNGEA